MPRDLSSFLFMAGVEWALGGAFVLAAAYLSLRVKLKSRTGLTGTITVAILGLCSATIVHLMGGAYYVERSKEFYDQAVPWAHQYGDAQWNQWLSDGRFEWSVGGGLVLFIAVPTIFALLKLIQLAIGERLGGLMNQPWLLPLLAGGIIALIGLLSPVNPMPPAMKPPPDALVDLLARSRHSFIAAVAVSGFLISLAIEVAAAYVARSK